MNGIIVRRALPSDVYSIASAENAYIDCPWNEAQIAREISAPDTVFLTAETGSVFCGYVSGVVAADECEMSNIAVEEKFRRCGVGRALMDAFLSALEVRGVKSVYLLVRDGNSAAISLYEKCGFEFVGLRKGYYKGKDARIMRLTL